MEKNKETLILFDVDGTLTKSRNVLYLIFIFLKKKIE